MERSTQILDEKLRKEVAKENSPVTEQSLWAGAFSVLKASLSSKGEYAHEAVQLLNKYTPSGVDESTHNALRQMLSKYSAATQSKAWEEKAFFSLALKTTCTPEAYEDKEWTEKTLELSMNSSPKVRRKALPVLRRIIEHEDREHGRSATFDRLVGMVEALCHANLEHGGKIVSILNNLHQEITKYGMVDRMLDIIQNIQGGAKLLSIPAVTFAHALLLGNPEHSLQRHLVVLELSAQRGAGSAEEFTVLLEYAAALFKLSNSKDVLGTEPFLVPDEGSNIESLLKELINREIERVRPEKIPVEVCMAIQGLLQGISIRLFPGFKKVIVALAYYCFTEKDVRMSKEIELIIGNVGVERFLKTIKEKEFAFWLPMMKSAIHSTDIEVFQKKFLPLIVTHTNARNRAEAEALWSCFPSFCRGMQDARGLIKEVLETAANYLGNPTVRGYIAQGIHLLVEEAHRVLSSSPPEQTALAQTRILRAIGESIGLFERLVEKFKREPTETERQCIKSMLTTISSEWQMAYFGEIIQRCFPADAEELTLPAGDLRPDYDRKEKDIPEIEKVFIDNAHLLEIVAYGLIGNRAAEEGVIRYCLSTHLRTQKMGYKVVLALIESGYSPRSLVDVFFHETAEKVMFICSRYLRLQVMYTLLKRHQLDDGALLCRVVFEMVNIVRLEGGKNRKAAFDIATEMTTNYSAEKLAEVCKMALAGVPTSGADYQAGGIVILTNLIYNGREKIGLEILDEIFDTVYDLSAKKVYASSKAIIGMLSVILIQTPHMDRYLERSLVCIDRVIYHFKMKLHDNLKLLLRKILEKRPIGENLSYPQKELLKHKGGAHHQPDERERIVTGNDGKLHIKDQELVVSRRNSRKRVKR